MKSEEALLARATVLCSILVSCLVIEVAAEDRTWIWNAPGQEAGTSPMTAINWTNAANWVDGILPGASDTAVFGSQSNPPHYVQLMENVVVNKLSSPNQLCIVGPGELQLAGSGSALEAVVVTYTPIRSLTTSTLYIGSISASTCYYYSPLYLQPGQICRIDSHSHFGRDKWSDTASETIVNPFPTNVISFYQTRSVYYYAPRGSAEVSGAWTLTSGSPYLTLAGEPHTVAVGAVVSGEGIPEGAFVKRVFSDNLIEISASATTNLTANALTFSAFSPRVTQRIRKLSNASRSASFTPSIYFNKYRAEDEFRIDIDEVALDANFSLLFTSSSGYVPGQVVFHKTSGNKGPIRLGNCDVAFAEDSTGFSSAVTMASGATANVSVFDGASASLGSFGGFIGSFVKKGGGALNVSLTDGATSGGSVSVCDGALNLNGAAEGEVLQLASLSLEDDAVLDVGTLTVCCEAFDFAAGAHVKGAGMLVVPIGTVTNGLDIASTVKVAFGVVAENRISADEFVHDLPEAGVPGDPVFWFDASDESSLTLKEEGSQIVKKWDDHRGSSYFSAAPWTAGNETTCIYRGSDGKGRFVRTINSSSTTEANRNGLKFVRSVSGIKVLFKVISIYGYDSDYGAVLLGGTSFKREKNETYISSRLQPIFYTNEVQAALIGMPVYINGERCDWHDGYPYAGEGTANVDQCRPMVVDMAFPEGANMSAGNFGYVYKRSSGHDNIHECIAYTNELSVSDILKVRRYLIEKWVKSHVNHDPYLGSGRATEGVGSYFVGSGDVASFGQVTGAGSLCKYGDGELNVGDIASTDAQVHVAAGRLRLSSAGCTAEELPSGLAFHVDADDEDSFTFDAGDVQAWGDTRGAGYPTAYKFATAPLREQEPSLGNRYVVSLGSRQISTGYSASRDLAFNDIEHIQTVVAVMGKEDTYGYLLGYTNGVAKTFREPWGLYRDSSSADNAILSTGSSPSRLSISVTGGGLSAWLNGVGVNPFEQTFSGGWDVVSVSTYQGVTANSFCSAYVSSRYYFGGKKLAECLIFTNALTAAETKSVEAYLNRKWFDRETAGCRIQSVAALSVDAGAELVVDGNRPVSTGSLRLEGRVSGSVALDPGATLYVNVVDGEPMALDVTGTIDVSKGGSVVLSSKVRTGDYDLCPAAGVCGRWTVEGAMAPYGTLHVENGRFMLMIRKGLKVILR